MRAGKIKTGRSVIANGIKKGDLKLIIIANDASDNIAKLITDKCRGYKVPFRRSGSRDELGIALRKGERVNVGITSPDFAKKLLSVMDECHKE